MTVQSSQHKHNSSSCERILFCFQMKLLKIIRVIIIGIRAKE